MKSPKKVLPAKKKCVVESTKIVVLEGISLEQIQKYIIESNSMEIIS